MSADYSINNSLECGTYLGLFYIGLSSDSIFTIKVNQDFFFN